MDLTDTLIIDHLEATLNAQLPGVEWERRGLGGDCFYWDSDCTNLTVWVDEFGNWGYQHYPYDGIEGSGGSPAEAVADLIRYIEDNREDLEGPQGILDRIREVMTSSGDQRAEQLASLREAFPELEWQDKTCSLRSHLLTQTTLSTFVSAVGCYNTKISLDTSPKVELEISTDSATETRVQLVAKLKGLRDNVNAVLEILGEE